MGIMIKDLNGVYKDIKYRLKGIEHNDGISTTDPDKAMTAVCRYLGKRTLIYTEDYTWKVV